jgi:hypothetical protein
VSRITEFAVSKRSVTLLLAGALFLVGIYSWNSLQQELLPDIEFPVITVIAPYPGAGAADVTDQVTKPIERAISGVPRLLRLQSTSANSVSVVISQFSFGTDVKEARTAIEGNLAGVGLPQGVTPDVTALNINQSPVIIASISAGGEAGLEEAARIARTDIVPALLGIDGVGSVDVTGGLEQRALVTLDPGKLAQSGISLQQINGVLAANNLTLPSGQLPADATNIPVSTTNQFSSLDEIGGLVVGVTAPAPATTDASAGSAPMGPGTTAPVAPTPVTIADLGTVELAGVATTGYARTDGEPSITLTVSKTSGANTVSVAEQVSAELAAAQERHPDIRVLTVSDLSGFIKESRDGLVREGGLGAVFAILTIFLFLGSLRSTLVAAVSIPLSILAALTLMLVTGISMNIMTLGGLAVAIGLVVDDAIVVLENIYRHRSRGDERMDRRAHRGARGLDGDHREHRDHRHGVPAARLRWWPRQPVLPAVRADGHVRPARVAPLCVDRRTGPGLLPRRPDQGRGRRDGRAEALHLGPAVHADDPLRAPQPPDEVGGGSDRRPPLRRLVRAPALHPDPVHQCRQREDPPDQHRPAARHELDRGPGSNDRGRDDPRRRSERGAHPVEHPGRVRHGLPGADRGVLRAAVEQLVGLRPARPGGRPQGVHAQAGRRSGAHQDGRLRRRGV